VPQHQNLRASEAHQGLARGEIDVAFHYEPVTLDDVELERLGTTGSSVYCGRGHPLFGARRVTRAMILAHPFSVPMVGDAGRSMDGWPIDVARRVGMRITLLRSNLEVCRSGILLAVLPDVTAAGELARGRLRRLPFAGLPPIEVFAAHGASGDRALARAVIERVRARLRPAVAKPARTR
jgi:DNA-binding transcriptional LysR family regulator